MKKTTWPSIDHGLLSNSGRMSKHARKAALERERRKLFGDGLPFPKCEQPPEAEILLRQAAELRELAKRGMKPRAYLKKAIELEAKAKALRESKND